MAIAINGTGTITGLTAGGLPDASVVDADIVGLTSSKLSGTLPAISGTNLTNLPAANLTGTLPAISGASLTNLPAGGEDGLTNNSNTTWMTVSADEQINMPLQPCVNAYNAGNDFSSTGDGTAFKVELNTERFDQGGDHNTTTDEFTAPITGRYLIIANVSNFSAASGHTSAQLRIWTSNDQFIYYYNPYTGVDSGSTNTQANYSMITEMEAGDVCYLINQVSGGAKALGTAEGVGVTMMCVQLLA